jgi:MFS family permease
MSRRDNPFAALSVLSLGLFMTLLDVTIVNVAIPQLVDSLNASIDEALWVLNAYVLVLGVCLITAGRLGDIFGPIALTLWIVPDLRPGRRHRLDMPGVLVSTLALTAITYALIEGQRYDWDARIIGLLVGGAVLLAIFVWMQRRRQTGGREPLVPFALFKDRNYGLILAVAAAVHLGMAGLFLPFTIYLQSVLGLSALEAGLVYVPFSLTSMVFSPVSGRLTDRIGGKYILMPSRARCSTSRSSPRCGAR